MVRGTDRSTTRERERNEQRQQQKRLGKPLQVGDSVILLLPGMTPAFQPHWDARWEIIRARDPVYWIRHLPTGREKVLNREKLKRVPSDVDWNLTPHSDGTAEREPEAEAQLTDDRQPAETEGQHQQPEHLQGDATLPGSDHQVNTPTAAQAMPPESIDDQDYGDIGSAPMDVLPYQAAEPTAARRYPGRKRKRPKHLQCFVEPKHGRYASWE